MNSEVQLHCAHLFLFSPFLRPWQVHYFPSLRFPKSVKKDRHLYIPLCICTVLYPANGFPMQLTQMRFCAKIGALNKNFKVYIEGKLALFFAKKPQFRLLHSSLLSFFFHPKLSFNPFSWPQILIFWVRRLEIASKVEKRVFFYFSPVSLPYPKNGHSWVMLAPRSDRRRRETV